jgi:universal stress protein A
MQAVYQNKTSLNQAPCGAVRLLPLVCIQQYGKKFAILRYMNTQQLTPEVPALDLKKILVPVDFSDASDKALAYAVAFARQFHAKILLLHVVHVSYMAGEYGPIDVPVLEDQLIEAAKQKIQELAKDKVPAELLEGTAVCAGPAVHEIAELAKERNTDLIILSTHGYTGLKRVMLGSVTENVVRHAPCPVLVVREREHEFIHEQPA